MSAHQPARKVNRSPNKRKALSLVIIGVGLIVLSGAALVILSRPSEAPAQADSGEFPTVVPVQVDFAAPEINLTDLQGNPVSLSEHKGQVVLVNNWAIWCPPCKAEMPVLQSYFNDHKGQGFTIIAIEAGEPVAEVKAFTEQYGLTFPVWPDEDSQALVAFRNNSLPSSYVLDRNGQVRYTWTGAISREMLEKYITPMIEE